MRRTIFLPLLTIFLISNSVMSTFHTKEGATISTTPPLIIGDFPIIQGTWKHIPLRYIQNGHQYSALVYSITFSEDGTVWVGTDHGLWSVSGGKTKRYTSETDLLLDPVNTVQSDQNGDIWFSYNKYSSWISSWHGSSISSKYLLPGKILAIETARDGTAWVIYSATEISLPGLAALQDGEWKLIQTDSEFLAIPEDRSEVTHSVEYSIHSDIDGSVWVLSDTDIVQVDLDGKTTTYSVNNIECFENCSSRWRKLIWGKGHTLWGW